MRRFATLFAAAFVCAASFSQTADDPRRGEESDWYREIPSSEPQLPNRPMRRENISDDEVREVQDAALQVYPDFIVVISSVTDGCACEEGGQCSAQVGLALNRNNVTRSLMLSKINGHWKVGAVQTWWLKYHEFERTHPRPTNWDGLAVWERARQALLRGYPACPVPAGNWTLLRTDRFGSTWVDESSMVVSGSIRRVKFKHVPEPKRISNLPWVRFSIDVEAFDSKDHRMREDKGTLYLSDGTAEKVRVEDSVLWWPIRPEAIAGSDLELVCGWKVKE